MWYKAHVIPDNNIQKQNRSKYTNSIFISLLHKKYYVEKKVEKILFRFHCITLLYGWMDG